MRTLHELLTRNGEHALLAAIARRLSEGAVVLDYRSGELELARGGRDTGEESQSAGASFEPGLVANRRQEVNH